MRPKSIAISQPTSVAITRPSSLANQAITGLALFLIGCSPAFSAAPSKGWVLQQNNNQTGSTTLYLTDGAIRAKSKDFNFVISGPHMDVCAFNDKQKAYCESTLENFEKKFGGKNSQSSGKYLKKGPKRKKISGLHAQQYFLCVNHREGSPPHATFVEKQLREVWLIEKTGLPQRVVDVCLAMCGLPKGFGLPVNVIRLLSDTQRESVLETLAIKKTQIAASTFNKPTGYRKVKKEIELLAGSDGAEDITDLLSSPGS